MNSAKRPNALILLVAWEFLAFGFFVFMAVASNLTGAPPDTYVLPASASILIFIGSTMQWRLHRTSVYYLGIVYAVLVAFYGETVIHKMNLYQALTVHEKAYGAALLVGVYHVVMGFYWKSKKILH